MTTKSNPCGEAILKERASIPEKKIVSKEKLPKKEREPVEKAKEALKKAINPYSNFSVGAVLASEEGFYRGANREQSDYDTSACAERVLLHDVDLNPKGGDILGITTETPDGKPNPKITTPCGICRQVIADRASEIRGSIKILLGNGRLDRFWSTQISHLLPYPLDRESFKKGLRANKDKLRSWRSFDGETQELIKEARRIIDYAGDPKGSKSTIKEGAAVLTENSGMKLGASNKHIAAIRDGATSVAINALNTNTKTPFTITKVVSVTKHEKDFNVNRIFPLSGKARQIIFEQAEKGGSDPEIIMASYGFEKIFSSRITNLLPQAFGHNQI